MTAAGEAMLAPYRADLDALAAEHRLRSLAPREGRDFTSNDYLALADSEGYRDAARAALARGVPIGAAGSRLLRGNHPEHEALEAEAARFFGAQSALYFGAGFSANEALLATLPRRGDVIVHDALIHASAHEGVKLSRATSRVAAHNDVCAMEDAIKRFRAEGGTGRVFLAVESLYSMDGDVAPLEDLAALADRREAFLLIDEAHATGALGPGGRGLAAALEGRENVVTLHTCGKALGVFGALICLPSVLRDAMINRCRSFIFATAPSPLMAACVRAALTLVESADDRRAALRQRVAAAHRLAQARCGLDGSGSHILPVIVGANARALAIAARLRRAGFDIRAIRPPTVPQGTARLRIALTLHQTEDEIAEMIDHLAAALAAEPA